MYGLVRGVVGLVGLGALGGELSRSLVVRHRLLKVPDSSIAGAQDGTVVQIRGIVAASAGVVLSPINEIPSVYVRTSFRLGLPRPSRERTTDPTTIDVAAHDFLVEDERGHSAIVRVAGAFFCGRERTLMAVPRTVDEPDSRLEAFLRSKDTSVENLRAPGLKKRRELMVFEQRIGPGDEVWVVGCVERLRSSGGGDGYRASANPEIAIRSAARGWSANLWAGLYLGHQDVRAFVREHRVKDRPPWS